MYVNNIEPEMFLPPGSESFNHNATRTTSSRSRSNYVNNNIVPVYFLPSHLFNHDVRECSVYTCIYTHPKAVQTQTIRPHEILLKVTTEHFRSIPIFFKKKYIYIYILHYFNVSRDLQVMCMSEEKF